MQTRHDDLTIERWRIEPRVREFEWGDVGDQDPAPPLWTDVTLAAIVAVALWIAAAAVFA